MIEEYLKLRRIVELLSQIGITIDFPILKNGMTLEECVKVLHNFNEKLELIEKDSEGNLIELE